MKQWRELLHCFFQYKSILSPHTFKKGVFRIETNVYVSLTSNSYSYVPLGIPCEFKLNMPSEKARVFERIFQQIDTLEFDNMVRAHLPYLPYHMDESNHEIDNRLMKIYAIIHQFGDEETKKFVERLPYFNN